MKQFLKTFFSDTSGASAAEYALILSIVGVALAAAALALAYQISGSINAASNKIAASCPDGNCGDEPTPPAPPAKQ